MAKHKFLYGKNIFSDSADPTNLKNNLVLQVAVTTFVG